MYFEIIAYLKCLINNFTVYLMSKFMLTVLRDLDPPTYPYATGLIKQVEDVFNFLNFIFSTRRNTFQSKI